MVGTQEERQKGHDQAATEFFNKYREVIDIRYQYSQEFHKEITKDRFNYKKLFKLTKEIEKIGKLKEKLRLEDSRSTRYRTTRSTNFHYENQITKTP